MPDISIADLNGRVHRLWDYRQKTHLVLLFGDGASSAEAALAAARKMLDWLGVTVIACGLPAGGFGPGATAIDRYGRVIGTFPFGPGLVDRIEKEFLYYEARHC